MFIALTYRPAVLSAYPNTTKPVNLLNGNTNALLYAFQHQSLIPNLTTTTLQYLITLTLDLFENPKVFLSWHFAWAYLYKILPLFVNLNFFSKPKYLFNLNPFNLPISTTLELDIQYFRFKSKPRRAVLIKWYYHLSHLEAYCSPNNNSLLKYSQIKPALLTAQDLYF